MGHLIDLYGFVPNGNRVYYLNRSQPPLLTWCVYAYYQETKDVEFVRSAMSWLEKEMHFFTTHKRFNRPEWKTYLFRYHVVAQGPRFLAVSLIYYSLQYFFALDLNRTVRMLRVPSTFLTFWRNDDCGAILQRRRKAAVISGICNNTFESLFNYTRRIFKCTMVCQRGTGCNEDGLDAHILHPAGGFEQHCLWQFENLCRILPASRANRSL